MLRSKRFYVSKASAIAAAVVVVVLLLVEGLLVGLVGRPNCNAPVGPDPEPVTTLPSKATSTRVQDTTVWKTSDLPGTTAPFTTVSFPETTTSSETPEVWENSRLPLSLVPSIYKVWLKPVLEIDPTTGLYIFYGSSSVQYTCKNSTNLVILHSSDLNYSDPLINNFHIFDVGDGEKQTLAEVIFYTRNEYLILRTEAPCVEGHEYNLTVASFYGELGDDLNGLYRSEYVTENGERKIIATTQMEDKGARRTFPCFDEPAFKAMFEITLLYRSEYDYFAISNMPSAANETVTDESGIVWDSTTFQWTPVMSTYLLAMVVCDFSYQDSYTQNNIRTRIYARNIPVRNGETEYAADITPKVLEVIEQHYKVPFPLNKTDQTAVPDFSFGAMENWGLNIYREINLLYDEDVTSVYGKYTVVLNIAHEFAHQWFGNLVTTHWWSDIWLNEGFASYAQYIGVGGVRPSWKVEELFIIDDLQDALMTDDSSDSHPLHHPEGYFSVISYSKGASFVRMIENFMGNETFTNAITNYLLGNQYNVVTYPILFKYLAAEADNDNLALPEGFSLDEILEPWVVQMGYPLLNVTSNGTNFIVTQEHFLIDPDDTPRETPGSKIYKYRWFVPFTYKPGSSLSDAGNLSYIWMHPEDPIIIPKNGEDFILANIDAVGFYRVNYDVTMWEIITDRLQSASRADISSQNRAQLIDDVFAITRSGRITVEIALNLASYLKYELDYIPWETFYKVMMYFDRMLASTNFYGEFTNFISKMAVSSIYADLGWDDTDTSEEAQIERMTRGLAIQTTCYFGLSDCIETAKNMFQSWMDIPDNNTISSTYRSDVYCTGIRAGGVTEWDFAWSQYLTVDSAQEQSYLRYGMTCSRNPWIINRFLEYSLNNTKVRIQDIKTTWTDIASHEHSKYIAWSFAQNNWDLIINTVGSDPMDSLLSSAVKRFSTEFDLDLIDSLRDIAGPSWNSTLNSYHDEVIDNLRWRMNNEDKVKAWLHGDPIHETATQKSLKYRKIDGVTKIRNNRKLFNKRRFDKRQ